MKDHLQVVRWLVLIACVAWGLLQLNAAIAAFWLAGGPPTPNPDGWSFIAGNRLAWAAASFVAGAALFFLLRGSRPVNRYAIAGLVVAALLAAYPYFREFMATDECLDSGGKWYELHCVMTSALRPNNSFKPKPLRGSA